MDRQEKFVGKIKELNEDDALVKCLWDRSQHLDMYNYYDNLTSDNYDKDITNRRHSIISSEKNYGHQISRIDWTQRK